MILVKAAPGLVIELATGESGRFDTLSVRLAEGLSSAPLRFEVGESPTGRLLVRPLEARMLGELTAYLGAIAANEIHVLAEVRKYRAMGH